MANEIRITWSNRTKCSSYFFRKFKISETLKTPIYKTVEELRLRIKSYFIYFPLMLNLLKSYRKVERSISTNSLRVGIKKLIYEYNFPLATAGDKKMMHEIGKVERCLIFLYSMVSKFVYHCVSKVLLAPFSMEQNYMHCVL